MQVGIGIITVILAFVVQGAYTYDILRGRTKPHLFTMIVWGIVTGLAFLGQVAAGGGPGAWTTGTMALLTLVTLALTFKYGTKDVTRMDLVFFVAALLAIIPWLLTEDPTLSVILATIIDVLAFIPAIRKTMNDPSSEYIVAWVINFFRHGLSILALSTFVVATYIYPGAIFIMNGIMIFIILFYSRRKRIGTLKSNLSV